MSDKKTDVTMEDIVSLCKRRGFIFQGSEIYGGLAGTWDYGPLGVQLKKNLMDLWWKTFVESREDMVGVDAAILMNPKAWQASGHVETFTDPLVECTNCNGRFREDKIDISKCPTCGKEGTFGDPRPFNMMLKTWVGPTAGDIRIKGIANDLLTIEAGDAEIEARTGSSEIKITRINDPASVYLRPETAQGIFTNFKNVVDTLYPEIPFGIAQQGKAFRNEISPRDFVFRSREFNQMEIEYFVHPVTWKELFEKWRVDIKEFLSLAGVDVSKVSELEVAEEDLAHYSKRTIDYEFEYPHGKDELLGLAYRTSFDLDNVERESGKKMLYAPKTPGQPAFVPHVIEPSFGVERLIMAVLLSCYREDELNGEKRIFLALPENIAPVRFMVCPLVKNKPEIVAKAREVFGMMKNKYGAVIWDDNANVGKRYRRADEIGVPKTITIDYQTLEDDTVTVRDRDTSEQTRITYQDL
jgi:glycyl-tRNA synthetase